MRVVVVLQPETAQELQSPSRSRALEPGSAGTADLQAAVGELGVSLTPMYPGQNHPTLVPYFYVDVPDQATADRVIARLNRATAVEAAYQQPDAEPPGLP